MDLGFNQTLNYTNTTNSTNCDDCAVSVPDIDDETAVIQCNVTGGPITLVSGPTPGVNETLIFYQNSTTGNTEMKTVDGTTVAFPNRPHVELGEDGTYLIDGRKLVVLKRCLLAQII